MADRKSFILYFDSKELIDKLTTEQKGILLDSVFSFAMGKNIPDMDALTDMVFTHIKSYMIRDMEKYESICEKRAEYGRKGGEAKAKGSISQHKVANDGSSQNSLANLADNDNKNEKDNGSGSGSYSDGYAQTSSDLIRYFGKTHSPFNNFNEKVRGPFDGIIEEM